VINGCFDPGQFFLTTSVFLHQMFPAEVVKAAWLHCVTRVWHGSCPGAPTGDLPNGLVRDLPHAGAPGGDDEGPESLRFSLQSNPLPKGCPGINLGTLDRTRQPAHRGRHPGSYAPPPGPHSAPPIPAGLFDNLASPDAHHERRKAHACKGVAAPFGVSRLPRAEGFKVGKPKST
jgi:hypothetical protein